MGDVDGMAALYEPEALLDCGEGRLTNGREAIRKFYGEVVATGRKFELGEQRAAMVCGALELTSTRLPDGTVTAEIARRQSDGTWLWVTSSRFHQGHKPRMCGGKNLGRNQTGSHSGN